VLAIGLVVDDAIIVVENVDRHMKAGQPPLQAAILADANWPDRSSRWPRCWSRCTSRSVSRGA
jgi:hypothetical protein